MNFSEHLWINVPLDTVWTRVHDLRSAPEYIPFLDQAESVEPGGLALGSHVRFTFRRGSQTLRSEAVVTAYEPQQRIALRGQVPGVNATVDVDWQFLAERGGTRWGQELTITFGSRLAEMAGKAIIGTMLNEARILEGMELVKSDLERSYREEHGTPGPPGTPGAADKPPAG